MNKIKLFIIITLLVLSSGCYNYRELNQLAIISAVGIDKKNDEWNITIQVVNTIKEGTDTGASTSPKFTIYEETGKTLQEALRKMILISSKRIYAEHLSVVVFGEDVAKEGIEDALDFFYRDSEFRKRFQMIVAKKSTANNLLKIVTPVENLNAKNIIDTIKTNEEYLGIAKKTTFEDLMKIYLNKKEEFALPSVEITGDVKKGEEKTNLETTDVQNNIIISDTAIFKGTKLVGYLTELESIALSFVKNKIDKTILTYKCNDENYMSIEIINTKADLKIKDALNYEINIDASARVNEINCNFNLEKESKIKNLEKKGEDYLDDLIHTTLNKITTYNSDILGLRNLLYKKENKIYETIKDDWYEKYYSRVNFKVNSKIKITELGNSLKAVK